MNSDISAVSAFLNYDLFKDIPGITEAHWEEVVGKAFRLAYAGDVSLYLTASARAVAGLIPNDPVYDFVAGRLQLFSADAAVGVTPFKRNISGFFARYVTFLENHDLGNAEVYPIMDEAFSNVTYQLPLIKYAGATMLLDRYFMRREGLLKENWSLLTFRVACGISRDGNSVPKLMEIMTNFEWLPSTPTLFNAGLKRSQMSSCYLLDAPNDDIDSIYYHYKKIANLSKFAGGVATSFTQVRSQGSHIAGTNGPSNGIVPFLKILDSSVHAINQGSKRKGACAVYIEPWHADIYSFLELKDNTGDEARRTHNLNTANWVPDLFMERVSADAAWTLFDPKDVPELHNLWGPKFNTAYEEAEASGLGVRTVKARDLYARMMRTLAETGNGWMCFKDAANRHCPQVTEANGNVVHSSNLCTEILEVTNNDNTAVCNLGSLNAEKFVSHNGKVMQRKLFEVVTTVVSAMDVVIDRNFYPTEEARRSNLAWRPIGLGLMGLNDAFFRAKLAFDSEEALKLSTQLQKEIYDAAHYASTSMGDFYGSFPKYAESRYAYDGSPAMRNSLLIAIAPTASIADIASCYASIDQITSNMFKRTNLSGEFVVVNHWLVNELKPLGLWTDRIRSAIMAANGSVQDISEIPADIRKRYKTAWEISNKAAIDLAAARQPFIDQSQSLNLFVEDPTLDTLSSMYMYAWKKGLKTTYYLRSRGATAIRKVEGKKGYTDMEKLMCSLENPENCEACQ